MKEYYCNKCGSADVFIDDRGSQKALMCGDCGAWLKWIGKKELPLIERYINSKCQAKERNVEIRVFDHDLDKVAYKKLTPREIQIIEENIELIFY